MLSWLGLGAILALLGLIVFRVTSVLAALILVPVAAALAGGFGPEIGTFALDGIRAVTPVAALLAFAVIYFGVMNDAGLFDPLVRGVVRLVGRDPVRIAVGTAALAAATHLDGAGASTFMVTIPAMLPLYRRTGMDPLVLAAIVALSAGTMNMLPWAGPTIRAAAALHVSVTDIFTPVVPAMLAGLAGVLACAVHLGRGERRRLALVASRDDSSGMTAAAPAVNADAEPRASGDAPPAVVHAAGDDIPAPVARPDARWYVNAALTAVTLGALFAEALPLAIVFVVASALALVVNYPDARRQRERLTAHGSAAMMMVTTIFAAGVFTGILGGSGMMSALSADLVRLLPEGILAHLPVPLAVASMPLSLAFDPDSFYFGLLPVLADAARAAGGASVEAGRAAILGQMTTGFPVSPLTPATFLLLGLAGVDLADHQRRTIPYAFGLTVVMTFAAVVTGAIRL